MLRSFEWYLAKSGLVLAIVVVAALTAMVILNAATVLTRTLGVGSLHWAHEVSLILAVGVYFLSYGIIVRRHAEIRVEFLAKRLPGRVQDVLAVLGDVLQLCLYLFLGYLGVLYANRISVLPMPMTRVSQALIIIPLVIGFLDASCVVVLRFLLKRKPQAPQGLSRETV
jgi:TRAP-type C4-dicarboxylate transport system permease small subunit